MKKLYFSRRNIFGLLFIALFSLQSVSAQQIVDFSLFRENAFLYNPAIAGSERVSFGALSGRMQWTGINESPFTASVMFHTRLNRKNVGIGGYIFNDFTGPSSYTGLNFSFAYHIVFSEYRSGISEYKALSFGLAASVIQYRLNGNKIILDQAQDDAIFNNRGTQIFPDASFGIHYKSKTLFASVAIPQLLHLDVPVRGQNGEQSSFRKMQHYYLMFGGSIHVNKKQMNKREMYLQPAFNMHYVINAPPQGVVSVRFAMEDLFFIGAGYRSLSTAIFEGGFTISKQFSLAYAYDFAAGNQVRTDVGQVHEINLSYKFNKDIFGY